MLYAEIFYGTDRNSIMENRTKYSLLKSAAINAVILAAVLAATHMMYETNDDYAIASRIVDGYPEVNFVNYYLCLILVKIQAAVPSLNAYVIFMILGSYVSFTCILKLIMDRTDQKIIYIASALVIALFSVDHYCTIQFTKTAALMISAALMLMLDTLTRKRNVLHILLSLILLYAGAALRIDGLMVAVGFAGLYLLYWLFINRKRLTEEGYLTAPRILLYIVLLALTGGCLVFNHMSYLANTGSEGLKAYKEYSQARSDVVDFGVYDNYDQNAAAYEEIGISENDLNLIDHWYFDYDGAASLDNLIKIKEIDNAGTHESYSVRQAAEDFIDSVKSSVLKLGFTGIHIIILCIIALWMIIALHPRHWLYIIATGAFAACLYMALHYMQRPAYRAQYMADIGAAMWLLYTLSTAYEYDREVRGTKRRRPLLVMGICTSLIAAMLLAPLFVRCNKSYDGVKGKLMPAELAEYIGDHSDSFFVFATSEKKSGAAYLTPWKAPDTKAEKNVMGTGSWGTMSPYVLDKLGAYGLKNPIKDLIDNSNAYYIGNKRIGKLTEYYNKWYGGDGKTIRLEQVSESGGYKIWKVVSQDGEQQKTAT